MKRRQGFTLVELLVAMALIMFIMAILSTAFAAATGTFRNLKATGDMAEKLRATTQLLTRDLAADHFQAKQRLSNPNFWSNGPPQQGFFQILQGGVDTTESPIGDPSGINSYSAANHSLAFTIKLRGNQMSDFLSASGSMGALSAAFGPVESRYQPLPPLPQTVYNYQWAEVAWFMVGPQTETALGTPLYTLYRRQRLLVPDNSLVPQQPAANASQFLEVSYCQPAGPTGPLYFNSPSDITDPQRRFGNGTGAYSPIPQGLDALSGSDIQLTDVVSFDVRVLVQGATAGVDPFITLQPLWQPPPTGYNNGNSGFGGAMVFDTWSSIHDGLGNSYAQWNTPGQVTSIPLWNGTSGPIILAIQISIRIWDVKTNQTRQVTMIQAM